MRSVTTASGSNGLVELEEAAARQIGFLKVIIGGLGSLLVVAFFIGIIWANLKTYEEKVDNQHASIAEIRADISSAKKGLSALGNDYSDMETGDDMVTVCPSGSAIVGIIRRANNMLIRCASLGKAVWAGTGETNGAKGPNQH